MRIRVAVLAAVALASAACGRGFRVAHYPGNEDLFAAGLREYNRGKWGHAILAFEKLTNDLSARDTLLPRAYWYLARSHTRQNEHLLAAQGYTRLFESFPDDTLADEAAFEAGRSYRNLWRKPGLDPTYGELALATFNSLLGLYPSSEHADAARQEILGLEQWFATKEYQTGLFYFRRKAYDSANIYFLSVVERWPHVPRVRDALLRLAESYRAIHYRENYQETCARLREAFTGDRDVDDVCRDAPVVMPDTARPPASHHG